MGGADAVSKRAIGIFSGSLPGAIQSVALPTKKDHDSNTLNFAISEVNNWKMQAS